MAKASKGNKSNKGKTKKTPAKKKKGNAITVVKKRSSDRLRLQKAKPQPSHLRIKSDDESFKHIVRIANRDVAGYLPLVQGLELIFGVSNRVADSVAKVFAKQTGKVIDRVGNLVESDVEKIEEIITNIDKHVPAWLLNRSKQIDNSESSHIIMADLKLVQRKEFQRLGKIKSYRGLRLQWGLPVRGQRTRSTFRRSTSVGVVKKK